MFLPFLIKLMFIFYAFKTLSVLFEFLFLLKII